MSNSRLPNKKAPKIAHARLRQSVKAEVPKHLITLGCTKTYRPTQISTNLRSSRSHQIQKEWVETVLLVLLILVVCWRIKYNNRWEHPIQKCKFYTDNFRVTCNSSWRTASRREQKTPDLQGLCYRIQITKLRYLKAKLFLLLLIESLILHILACDLVLIG